MKLTLKSLHSEMKESFGEVNNRIDRILLQFERQNKDNDCRFQQVDEHLKQIDQHIVELISGINIYATRLDRILDNHEKRLSLLEQSA